MLIQSKFRSKTTYKALLVLSIVVLVVGLFAQFRAQAAPATAPAGFVYRCGIHFCLSGNTYYFAGANTYDVFTFGSGSGDTETQFMDKAKIDAHFTNLQNDKVTVLRLWMFSHESWHGFEKTKGVYDEQEFSLFDYVIQSAKAHNVKLIPVFENYWEAYGGIDTRLAWEGLGGGQPARGQFFNKTKCPGCFTGYKNYVNYALNRVNHYSGIAYKNDPTIFAWELMNEPRYQDQTPNENSSGTTLRAWVDEMGAFIKSIDSNHMLDAGIEGHQAIYGFGGDEGNPFVFIQQSPYIDFTSAHPYPTEEWANLTLAQAMALNRAWISDSHNVVGKPFFMGEFNTKNVDRSTWWTALYNDFEAADGDGSAFWWYMTAQVDPNYGVLNGAPELAVFRTHSTHMTAKNESGPTATSPSVTKTLTRTPTAGTPVITTTPTRTPTIGLTPTRTATSVSTNNPDLTVSSVTFVGSSPMCANSPKVQVVVSNIGAFPATGSFLVSLSGSVAQTVNGLAAGQSATLLFAASSAMATVDSTNVIVETNEANNSLSGNFGVPTQGPTCTPTGPTLTSTRTPTGATPTRTRTATPTLTPTSGLGACSPVTSTITAPFTFDGAGTFCWQSSNLGTYINSWNTISVTINGVNISNVYIAAASYPAKINGFWYVSYNSSVAWGHLEAK